MFCPHISAHNRLSPNIHFECIFEFANEKKKKSCVPISSKSVQRVKSSAQCRQPPSPLQPISVPNGALVSVFAAGGLTYIQEHTIGTRNTETRMIAAARKVLVSRAHSLM